MSIAVHIWYAKHTSGTKFYQVLRFVNNDSGQSFAIAHFGGVGVFTGLGKVSTGQMQMVDGLSSGTRAGLSKIAAKKKDDYRVGEEDRTETFAMKDDLLAWCRANIGGKHLSTVRAEINKMDFTVPVPVPPAGPDWNQSPFSREPDEPNHLKHADWGSW